MSCFNNKMSNVLGRFTKTIMCPLVLFLYITKGFCSKKTSIKFLQVDRIDNFFLLFELDNF